ncbi:MAG: hypothetical protein KU37_07700 [Sulfuricurvum sp. PC08-66]|nr:MAG: hypothetical protein KU37_07700 [Sulfuricurvum sp. PC08-66]
MTKLFTTVVVSTIAAGVLMAAPKPLLNPFADTLTATTPAVSSPASTVSATTQSSAMSPQTLPSAEAVRAYQEPLMTQQSTIRLVVKGQGVAPSFTQSPAQAFAMAKRAAMVDAYRLLGEKISGVRVEGQDLIKNMMVKRSQVRTEVNAMIRQAAVVETEFKDGLCEVEVELVIDGAQWYDTLAHSFTH